ncbi:MAG: sensor histidine kinase [Acetivibrionales bacterium]|jgi:two-component system sensor histidine kinase YesM
MNRSKGNHSLMKKLIKYFLLIILFMALLNAYSSYSFKSFYGNVYAMLNRVVDTYFISIHVGTLYQKVDNYAHSGDEKYLSEYDEEFLKLREGLDGLKQVTQGEEHYIVTEIQNMVETFDEKSKAIFDDYRNNQAQVFIDESVSEIYRLKGYIEDDIKNIIMSQLSATMDYYRNYWSYIRNRENMIYILTAMITAMCIFFAVRFSRQISKPIHQLVLRLQKVAKGDFEVDRVNIKTNDEINILVESFNYMISKIRDLIEEIKAKAGLEKQLHEQQIKNLEMMNLLNQSELKFLQSQINPHFLYNTMNSIAALALIEGAGQTKKMIESLSDILKYNLKKVNENVSLREECRIVESYLYIQKARFGERIKYKLVFDESIMDCFVPSMIIQPLVENAIIHGLEPKEEEGVLEVAIKDGNENILITIKDNGVGMDKEKLQELLDEERQNKNDSNKSIGVSNVLRRLKLKYCKNVIDVKSIKGEGTEICIKIPKN